MLDELRQLLHHESKNHSRLSSAVVWSNTVLLEGQRVNYFQPHVTGVSAILGETKSLNFSIFPITLLSHLVNQTSDQNI